MPRAPKCLHVPPLTAGKPAELSWEMMEGEEAVDSYELDCVYDETFEEAATGREWQDINGSGWSWADVEASGITWADFQQLSTRGYTWDNIHFAGLTWGQVEEAGLTWREMAILPVSFTVYRGPGERVPGPDDGWTWQNINAQGATWQEIEDREFEWKDLNFLPGMGLSWQDINGAAMTWEEIEAADHTWRSFALIPSRGVSWDTVQAHWLSWEEIEQKDLTWGDLLRMTHKDIHAGFTVQIPKRRKKAKFRIRTFKDGMPSPYLETEFVAIKPAFEHEDEIKLTVRQGEDYLVAIQGQGAESFEDVEMTVTYDAKALELYTDHLPTKDSPGAAWLTHTAEPVANAIRPGTVTLVCGRNIPDGKEWSGLVLCMNFKALESGETTIKLQ